jgi:hypothetical protein
VDKNGRLLELMLQKKADNACEWKSQEKVLQRKHRK